MSKNAVYYCYYGEDILYYELLKLSLKSLNKFFDKNNIFVYSDKELPEIQNLCNVKVITFPIGFAVPMAYRLKIANELFTFYHYDNILHLDLDTIVCKNIHELFIYTENNKISFATEKNLSINSMYHAGPLLNKEEICLYSHLPSICCGVFMMNKTCVDYVEHIYNFIVQLENNNFKEECRDQHGFCYYVLKNNLYNHNLENYVVHDAKNIINNNLQLNPNIYIYHFAGGVTSADKYEHMKLLLEKTRK